MKQTKKFFIRPLTAVSAFNYEVELPISDGVVICYQEEGKAPIELLTLYVPMYSSTCEIKISKTIMLADYIKNYDEFKALDATIEKAKYHINLAHEASITAAWTE